jgi:hypothetical protein
MDRFFVLLGIAMGLAKWTGIGEERAEAGFGAEIDGTPSILGVREAGGVSVVEKTSA